ncbi:MAG: ABC transporter permease [Chthoniobacterales bacterium]|nr:MAG: ABC transporter permease [Chthoniobacterales bacterium]
MTAPDFLLRMAWRDSRSSRRRLFAFSLSITLGVAALVAIGSFRQSLSRAIDEQARTLVGADLVVSSTRPFTPEIEELLGTISGRQAREIRFSTMAVFPGKGTRLVNLRALRGDFPFYGKMETDPAAAANTFQRRGGAILDQTLLFQFGVAPGSTISLGGRDFRVAGALHKIPGDATAAAGFAPRVYISLADLPKLNLLGPGSVARYRAYLQFPTGTDVAQKISALSPQLQKLGLQFETVEKRKRELGESLANLYRFLNLTGFIALLLGAVGMASAIRLHLQQKIRTSAILRCLGSSAAGAATIYLIQVAAMSLGGAIVGGIVGLTLQHFLPGIVQNFLPLQIPTGIAWWPILTGVSIGAGLCLLFALPPLLRFRKVSPLLALRAASADTEPPGTIRDPLLLFTYVSLAICLIAFSIWQSESWSRGFLFALALGVTIAIFAAVARLLSALLRRWFPRRLSFTWRQGLANLHRPNNRTSLLIISLGLGTFLLLSLHLTREIVLSQFRSLGGENQPNIFLFDIQPDQSAAVTALVRSLRYPIIQQAPIVTMRLKEVNGRKSSELLANPQNKIPEWELEREYRSTFRDRLTETEKITGGKWIGHVDYHPGDIVPISLDQEIANDLGVKIGDELVFDVQGVSIRTRIASLREVDWKRFQTNFFVVFPRGVLESAPTFNVLVSRAATPADSARLQNAVVAKFPNVSALDLATVIQTVDSILSKVALAIRVMSLFTIATGLIVVATAIWSGRYQRVEESVLLRTLGASRRQIRQILSAEYFLLGLLASVTGTILAIAASWALAAFVFKIPYVLMPLPLLVGVLSGTATTVLLGLLTSRGVGNAPPLQILRAEAS